MIYVVVSLLAAVLAGLLIKYLFLRQFEVGGSSRLLRIVIVILLSAGIALTVSSSILLNKKMASRFWPTDNGRVISSEIVGGTTYRPQIIYEFKAGGKTIRDTSDLGAPGFGGKNTRLEVAEASINQYPPNAEVTVHYDPDDPSDSVIRLSLGWDNLGKLGLGMTLILVNLIVMMSFKRNSNPTRQRID